MDIFHDYSDDRLCIFGDVNLPYAVWLSERSLTCFKKPGTSLAESTAIDLIREGYGYCGLAQVNTVFNSRDIMLDLIFVNVVDITVDTAIDYLTPPDAYHPPLIVCLRDLAPSMTNTLIVVPTMTLSVVTILV